MSPTAMIDSLLACDVNSLQHRPPCLSAPRTHILLYLSICQVLERIKDPLMTLMSRDHHETAYPVLAHFLVVAQRAPLIFASVRALQCTAHWHHVHLSWAF